MKRRRNDKNRLTDSDLLVERNCHFCDEQLIQQFKKLIEANDEEMYSSPYLIYSIKNPMKAIKSIEKFTDHIRQMQAAEDIVRYFKRSKSTYIKPV